MKKIILSVFALLAICISAIAQDTIYRPKPKVNYQENNRLNVYGAYVFDDNVNSTYDSYNYFEGTIKGGMQFGAGMEFMVREDYGVELLWIGQTTTAPVHYHLTGYYQERTTVIDLNLNYAMAGFGRHMIRPGSKVEGYGQLMLGALFASGKNKDTGSDLNSTFFAWGLKVGANVWGSGKVGLKLQAQLLSGVQAAGGGVYFGTGGAGAGISTYSTMFQFSLGGGLFFALGR